jgi:anti-sigma B factor antagonist
MLAPWTRVNCGCSTTKELGRKEPTLLCNHLVLAEFQQRKNMAKSNVALRELAGVTIVDFNGAIMIGESSVLFRKTIDELVGTGRTRILLNFRRVTAVDSAGVGELVATYALMRAKDLKLKLLSPSPKVHDLLTLTKLSNLFEVFSDEELALRSFEEP